MASSPGALVRSWNSFAFAERAVAFYWMAVYDFLLLIPVADEEEFLIWRERESIRAGEVFGDEFHFAVAHGIDAEVWCLTARLAILKRAECRDPLPATLRGSP